MPYTTCPGCDEEIYIPTAPRLGDVIVCRTCEADLEVVSIRPLELDWREEEDDREDDDEDLDSEDDDGDDDDDDR